MNGVSMQGTPFFYHQYLTPLAVLEILILLVFLVVFTLILVKSPLFRIPGAKRTMVLVLWGYKLIIGVSFYLMFSVYTPYSAGNDSEVYFRDGVFLSKIASEHPKEYVALLAGAYSDPVKYEKYTSQMEYWDRPYPSVIPNDNRIVIRLNSLIAFVSGGFYRVHLLFMAFLSFLGLLFLYKAVIRLYPSVRKTLVFVVFVIPSTVFWSAGILKEPILIFLLGVFVHSLVRLFEDRRMIHLWLLLICFFFMIYTKPYVLFILVPLSAAYILVQQYRIRKGFLIYLSMVLLSFAIVMLVSVLNPQFSMAKILMQKQVDFLSYLSSVPSGSQFEIPLLDGSYGAIVKNAPTALWNALFRPWLWEVRVWPQLIAALENLCVLLLLVFLVLRFRWSRVEHRNMTYFALFFSMQLLVLSGLITPNMGALVRFKSVGLPFLFLVLVSGYAIGGRDGRKSPIWAAIESFKQRLNHYLWIN